jgi:hypothetical protein
VRWVVRADGSVARATVGGCSDGFDQLWPRLQDLFRVQQVGGARLAAAPLALLVERSSELFQSEPELGVCGPGCVRCRDARVN